MARLAICPQCDHELFVPDDAQSEAWAKCPDCRAFFQVKQATLRELPSMQLIDVNPSEAEKLAAPTVEDLPTAVTWQESQSLDIDTLPEPELQLDEPDAPGSTAARIDEWFRTAKAGTEESESTSLSEEADDLIAESDIDDIDDELQIEDEVQIDDEPEIESEQPVQYDMSASNATIDLGSVGLDVPETEIDFQLDEPTEPAQSSAPWDDSQDMERLLADIEVAPADEFAPVGPHVAEFQDEHDHTPSNDESAIDVTPESLVARTNAVHRKRSLLRTLVMAGVSAVVGLGLGYYALFWLLGPSGDFLNVAHNLPSAILPASFKPACLPRIATAPPAKSLAEVAESAQNEPPALEQTAEQPTEQPEEQPAEVPAEEPAEIQAGYTTTEDPTAAAPSDTDDRYAVTADPTAETTPAEPAPLEQPPADELTTSTLPPAEIAATDIAAPPVEELTNSTPPPAVTIANAPSFTSADVSGSLDAAKKALPDLATGNLTDSREVARAKGFGYSMLADLAQKVVFLDAAADTVPIQQDAEQLFHQALSDPHMRSEVARILPKWMAAPSRKHGGVFFAGSVTSQENKGDVIECRVDIEGGQPVTILVPATSADRLVESARPVGIVGWIVDNPAAEVTGYTGTATQAIWAGKLIPLE